MIACSTLLLHVEAVEKFSNLIEFLRASQFGVAGRLRLGSEEQIGVSLCTSTSITSRWKSRYFSLSESEAMLILILLVQVLPFSAMAS